MDYKEIANIIIKERFETASQEELTTLAKWMSESKDNVVFYSNIVSGESIKRRILIRDKFENKNPIKNSIFKELEARGSYRVKLSVLRFLAVACMVGIIICAFIIYQGFEEKEESLVLAGVHDVIRNDDDILLVLPTGEEIPLLKNDADSLTIQEANLRIANTIIFPLSAEGEVYYNKIKTPSGTDYSFILPDGSRVWMNSNTTIEYPSNFVGKERLVKLNGEAYFDVVKDEELPFIVQTNNVLTKVIGTTFNINAYSNEETISTTLITGKVEVCLRNNESVSHVLKPGQQSIWTKGTDFLKVEMVDKNMVTAWRDGMFYFNSTDIETVLRVLERWYDVEFIYDLDYLKKHTFNGYISKDESLDMILETFTVAGGPKFKYINHYEIEVTDR